MYRGLHLYFVYFCLVFLNLFPCYIYVYLERGMMNFIFIFIFFKMGMIILFILSVKASGFVYEYGDTGDKQSTHRPGKTVAVAVASASSWQTSQFEYDRAAWRFRTSDKFEEEEERREFELGHGVEGERFSMLV